MSKKLFTLSAIVAIFALCSCSNESAIDCQTSTLAEVEAISKAQEKEAFLALKKDIKEFNASYFAATNSGLANYDIPQDTVNMPRKASWFSKFFNKLVAIVVCDAVGGLACTTIFKGNVTIGAIGGIASSLFAAICKTTITLGRTKKPLLSPALVNDSSYVFNGVILEKPELATCYTFADSVGYCHNKIIYDICNDTTKLAMVQNATSIELYDMVENEVIETFDIKKPLVFNKDYRPQVINEIEKIKQVTDSSIDYNDQFTILKATYPESSEELDVLKDFISNNRFPVTTESTTYVNQILRLIDNSDISDESKKELRMAISIANASAKLWNGEE